MNVQQKARGMQLPPEAVAGYLYLITNVVTKKIYVGITKHTVAKRWTQHKSQARCGKGGYLHSAIRKYQPESFTIETLQTALTIDQLKSMEIAAISDLGAYDPTIGYNLTKGGEGRFGWIASDEEKMVISRNSSLMWKKQGHREKTSAAHRERYKNPALKEKQIRQLAEMRNDPAIKEKISKSMRDKWQQTGYAKTVKDSRKTYFSSRTEDEKQSASIRRSEISNRFTKDPAYRKKLRDKMLARTPEQKKATSELMRKHILERNKDPEFRKRHAEAVRLGKEKKKQSLLSKLGSV